MTLTFAHLGFSSKSQTGSHNYVQRTCKVEKRNKQKNLSDITWEKQPSKMFFILCLLLAMGPTLKSGLFLQWDCLGGNFFICKSIGDSFWIRNGTFIRFQLWDLLWCRPMQAPCRCHSLWVHMCSSPGVSRRPWFPWFPSLYPSS